MAKDGARNRQQFTFNDNYFQNGKPWVNGTLSTKSVR